MKKLIEPKSVCMNNCNLGDIFTLTLVLYTDLHTSLTCVCVCISSLDTVVNQKATHPQDWTIFRKFDEAW